MEIVLKDEIIVIEEGKIVGEMPAARIVTDWLSEVLHWPSDFILSPEDFRAIQAYLARWPEGPQANTGQYVGRLVDEIAAAAGRYNEVHPTKKDQPLRRYGIEFLAPHIGKSVRCLHDWMQNRTRITPASWILLQKFWDDHLSGE